MSISNDFLLFLRNKGINAEQFKEQEPVVFDTWAESYEHMHPNSFVQRFKFLINPMRRRFPLEPDKAAEDKLPTEN